MHPSTLFLVRRRVRWLPTWVAAVCVLCLGTAAAENVRLSADNSLSPSSRSDAFTIVESLEALRGFVDQPGAKVRLKPGTYTLDRAPSRHFFEITASDSHWDLRGVKLRIDTELFRQFGAGPSPVGPAYCVFALSGDRITFEGVTTENFGERAGIQSQNKIFNITGSNVVLRDVDLTTSGSSPWGHGSLFGISGAEVRKMNGIRVGWPAKDVKLIGCRVHMRAMGHGIFIQGAQDVTIQDCHVDGLLRSTDEILAETSGFAYEKNFTTLGRNYLEGVTIGADGRILPGELTSLSEDGIRLYDKSAPGQPTGKVTIVDCTVTRMRRGFCVGLGTAADTLINCEARECVAAGFNLGSRDVMERCRADANYSEALALPYVASHSATVDLEILDSRSRNANSLLAVVNGRGHRITLSVKDPAWVPPEFIIGLATRQGYAFYQRAEPVAKNITLTNKTPAAVIENSGASGNSISDEGRPLGYQRPAFRDQSGK